MEQLLRPRYNRKVHPFLASNGVLLGVFSLCANLTMIDSFFSFYLLDHLVFNANLGGSTAGYILLAAELFNVVVGPFVSYIMELFPFVSFGRHRTWILISAIPLCISFVFIWYIPPFPFALSVTFYVALLLLFNLFYGTLLIAYEAVIPILFTSQHAMIKANSFRLFVGSIGAVISVFLIAFLTPPLESSKYRLMIIASIVAGFILICFVSFVFHVKEQPKLSTLHRKSMSDETLGNTQKPPSWWAEAKTLFKKKPFNVLILSHFLCWMIIILVHSTTPAYVREYLSYDKYVFLQLLTNRETEPGKFQLLNSTLVVVVLQLAASLIQIVMGIRTSISPERLLRWSMGIVLVSCACYFFLFELRGASGYLVPKWVIFVLAFINGLGIGGMHTAYEIMVPEVIVWEQQEQEKALVPAEHLASKEIMIYGFVDCAREFSIAVSFLIAGELLERLPIGLSTRVICGVVPFCITLVCVLLYAYFPKILIMKKKQGLLIE